MREIKEEEEKERWQLAPVSTAVADWRRSGGENRKRREEIERGIDLSEEEKENWRFKKKKEPLCFGLHSGLTMPCFNRAGI